MKIKIYQVDAFTDKLFSGNPAAVCPLDKWLDDKTLQKIAAENNLSETAFFVKENNHYHIRWMTPFEEVKLCGHATLASAFIIFNLLHHKPKLLKFTSKSGELLVEKKGEFYKMIFPLNIPKKIDMPQQLEEILKIKPIEVLFNESYVVVFENEENIYSINPDFSKLSELKYNVIVTAPGNKVDFISRFFAPSIGVNEDPVTGYAHTLLGPYWSKKLKKKELHAYQASKRGGDLFIKCLNDRVEISGKAVLYLTGEIIL
jgi:PhzF family phenazine biosynthesis protein